MSGNKRKRIAGDVSVGRSPRRLKEEIQTMTFRVHDFANLKENRGVSLMTPDIRLYGYDWRLMVYPKGDTLSSADTEYVSCYLICVQRKKDDEGPFGECSFTCKNKVNKSNAIEDFSEGSKGMKNYLTRKEVLDKYLDEDGTLVISVDLQLAVYKEDEDVWYPEPLQEEPSLVQLYQNSESTFDVSFDVDGTIFHAHKNIIFLRSKALFELTKNVNNNIDNNGDGGNNVVTISNMESDTFEQILKHVYTVKTIPEVEDDDTATKLLIASDRLGCTTLKLYVESIIVDKLLNPSNAALWLLLSDSHSCALLKEASLKIHKSDAHAVMESNDWSRVVESSRLLEELFKFVAVDNNTLSHNDGDNNPVVVVDEIEKLDVSSLRTKLSTMNLDIDGSRAMLVERLKEANSKK